LASQLDSRSGVTFDMLRVANLAGELQDASPVAFSLSAALQRIVSAPVASQAVHIGSFTGEVGSGCFAKPVYAQRNALPHVLLVWTNPGC